MGTLWHPTHARSFFRPCLVLKLENVFLFFCALYSYILLYVSAGKYIGVRARLPDNSRPSFKKAADRKDDGRSSQFSFYYLLSSSMKCVWSNLDLLFFFQQMSFRDIRTGPTGYSYCCIDAPMQYASMQVDVRVRHSNASWEDTDRFWCVSCSKIPAYLGCTSSTST